MATNPLLAINSYLPASKAPTSPIQQFVANPLTAPVPATQSPTAPAPTPTPTQTQATNTPAPAPTNPNGAVAPAPAPKPDKTNDINIQLGGLAQEDNRQATGLKTVDDALAGLTGKYDAEAANENQNFTNQNDVNTQNLQRNTQAAMVNGAQGRRSLFGVLASLGALSGSGIDLANLAVQHGVNADLGDANGTFNQNKAELEQAHNNFTTLDNNRREKGQEAAKAAKQGVLNDVATERQKMYSQLSNDYADMGDTNNAKKYADLAASLFPAISNSSFPTAGDVSYTPMAYTPSTLAQYVAGNNTPRVSSTPAVPGGLPGLVVSPAQRKQAQ